MKMKVTVIAVALGTCACIGSSPATDQRAANDAEALLDRAIDAHGGMSDLKAASEWVAEVRRHQGGDSYEVTALYRPGMVRLEQETDGGSRSAAVIGHPHCWGSQGPATIPCSAETRENDRPRVVMEMASQLWPLKEGDWEIIEASEKRVDDVHYDVVLAKYLPLDTGAELLFNKETSLLDSINVRGVKQGVDGTHTHVYSAYRQRCGVLMPMHNVKSFEGETWVAEDIIDIECRAVDEAVFERPTQVVRGYVDLVSREPMALACIDATDPFDSRYRLAKNVQDIHLKTIGMSTSLISESGGISTCAPVNADDGTIDQIRIEWLPASVALATYGFEASKDGVSELTKILRTAFEERGLIGGWPITVDLYDNDGMGPTGETLVRVSRPIGQ